MYFSDNANLSSATAKSLETIMKSEKKTVNYKKGERQTVYPLKKHEDIINMANWLMENKSPKYVLGFVLGANVGLRANELLGLKLKHVLWSDGSIRHSTDLEDTSDGIDIFQSKTNKHRVVFLNAECKAALEWYLPVHDGSEYLFSSREGGSITVGTFRKVLKEAAAACGIKQNIGTHTLRKTFGWHQYHYNCEKASLDISMLQRTFGHSSPEVTLRYLGITDEEDKALYHNMCIRVITDPGFCGKKFVSGVSSGECKPYMQAVQEIDAEQASFDQMVLGGF